MTARDGQIVTFYSYKGGTGRSMHLANVAWILASNGKRVLMVDWDLEAPGLHRYFHPFLIDKELADTDGLIDLMWDFADAAMTPVADAERGPGWHEELADFLRCTTGVRGTFPAGGCLDLLAAGRQGASYSQRVSGFNWQNFYDRLGGGAFLEAVKRKMRDEYDYVLIDSRTGVSDTAGICTVQLPDALVVCFTANNQSIEGCASIARSVRDHWASDKARGPERRRILPVLTRIDGSEKEKLNARRAVARARFESHLPSGVEPDRYWRDLEVPYVPWYSYEEVLAVFADKYHDKFSVLDAAEALTGLLTLGEVTTAVRPTEDERARILALFTTGAGEVRAVESPAPAADATVASPYPGAQAFSADNAAVFFGRAAELEQLVARLRAGERELYLVGPSGSGKSSLVRAGLLPLLERSPERVDARFVICTVRPGPQPAAALGDALAVNPGLDPARYGAAIGTLLERQPQCNRVLIVIDPLEELLTAAADERTFAIDAIVALRADPRVVFLMILRADFVGALMESRLGSAAITRIDIGPLRGEALREAIVGPARAAGIRLEPALVERLLADAGDEPGALPLVQETLAYLWHRRQGGVITAAQYAGLADGTTSGLAVALARRADVAFSSLDRDGRELARHIFVRLVSFGEGRAHTRRQQPHDALAAGEDALRFEATLRHLVEHRLLTTGVDSAGEVQIDLTHENLISGWPALRSWIDALRIDEQRRRDLEAKAAAWRLIKRDKAGAGLLSPAEADDAEKWLNASGERHVGISNDAKAYVSASRSIAGRRLRTRYRQAAVVALAAALAVATLSIIAVRARNRAEDAEISARVAADVVERAKMRLADANLAQGRALLVDDRGAQALPYLLAARVSGFDSRGLHVSFRWAAWQVPELTLRQRGAVTWVAWSPDGAMIAAAAGRDVRIWDAHTGKPVVAPLETNGDVVDAAWSPDSASLAIAGEYQTAIWRVDTGKQVGELTTKGIVHAMVWRPDGQRIALAIDGDAQVWDATTGEPIGPRIKPATPVATVSWTEDGSALLIADTHGTASVWDVNGARLSSPTPYDNALAVTWPRRPAPGGARIAITTSDWTVLLAGYDDHAVRTLEVRTPIADLAWSEDGNRIATIDGLRSVRIWDARTAEECSVAFASEGNQVALSPDGTQVAAAGSDGVVRVWQVRSRQVVPAGFPHASAVQTVAWTEDGEQLSTTDVSGSVHRWSATGGEIKPSPSPSPTVPAPAPTPASGSDPRPLNRTLNPPRSSWSAGARRIAIADDTGALQILSGADGSVICSPPSVGVAIAIAINADGTRVAASFDDKTARIWSVDACAPIGQVVHQGVIVALAWSPDGASLATASVDTSARVWAVALDGSTTLRMSFAHEGSVLAVAWGDRAGGLLTTAGEDRVARVWRAATGELVASTPAQPAMLTTVALSPDGYELLTTSYDGTARIWHTGTGSALTPPMMHSVDLTAAAWSPDGTLVATLSGNALRIWDTLSGQAVCPDMRTARALSTLAWSPDGTRVATGGDDGVARIWDLEGAPGELADWKSTADTGPYKLSDAGVLISAELPPLDDDSPKR